MTARHPFRRISGSFSLSFESASPERFQLRPIQPSPCSGACPAGVNVKAYVGLIAAGRFDEALEVVRRSNPFPAICGRVCHHPCESSCRRAEIDEPVAICALKRFIADYEMARPAPRVLRLPRTRPQSAAVIGSGPAGLTAASDLVRMGFGVTVFEAHEEAGGMLVLGIPEYRLPREVIRAEIQRILDMGVELRTGIRIGEDLSIRDLLRKEQFDAVFVAVGAHLPRRLGIPGEDGPGFEDCLHFMRRVNAGTSIPSVNRVLVLGGGHSAIDCARSALRLGCRRVQVVYRRSRGEMPAGETEVRQAEEEGVCFTYLKSPKRVIRSGARLRGLELIRNRLGDPDKSGRRRPLEVPGTDFFLPADLILSAVGQKPDLQMGPGLPRLPLSPWDTVRVDEETLQTSLPGVFAGGDAVTGPRTVIEAIAQGHRAALSIARHLDPAARFQASADALKNESWELEMEDDSVRHFPRAVMPHRPAPQRKFDFREVDLGFTQETAIKEAQRCLRCGPCGECSLCVTTCPKRQLMLSVNKADSPGVLVRFDSNGSALSRFSGTQALLQSREDSQAGESRNESSISTKVQLSDPACWIDSEVCRGCGLCVETCGYGAIRLRRDLADNTRAEVLNQLCKGCGVCAAICPTNAIQPGFQTDFDIKRALQHQTDPTKCVVFTCRWNPLAGRLLDAPRPGMHFVELPCAGRLHPGLILEAFQNGAESVLALTCRPDRCHYGFGSRTAAESLRRSRGLLQLLGIEPDGLRVWRIEEGFQDSLDELLRCGTGSRGEVAGA